MSSQLNPRHISLEQWVDSIRNERNAASAGDPDSLAWLAPADTLRVGTERALRLQPFCGDCEAYDIYAPAFGRVIIFTILYDIGIPGKRDEQQALYEAILATYQPNPGVTFDHRPNDR